MVKNKRLVSVIKVVSIVVAVFVIIVILWIDATTSIWQEKVILAGIAASIVSFLGTYILAHVILDRVKERRWAPVTGLALTDFMHSLADESRSEITRGKIVPRSIEVASLADINVVGSSTALDRMLSDIHDEQRALTRSLGRWAGFLASSGDNDEIMLHVAEISLQLEILRDAIIARLNDEAVSFDDYEQLRNETAKFNDLLMRLLTEIQTRLNSYHRASSVTLF